MADAAASPASTNDTAETGSSTTTTELARDLRLFDITMVGVGAMVGAGIFALTGHAAGEAGPGLILAFALNGLLTLCTAMVYAEVGSAIPGAGGGYLWVRFGLPGPSAFLAGWMDWLAHAVAGSLYAAVFGSYCVWGMQTIFGWGEPGLAEHDAGTLLGVDAIWIAKALTAAVCGLFIYINYRGSSETGKTGNIITMAKIITIVIFIIFGLVAIVRGGAGGDAMSDATVAEKFTPFLPNGMTGVLVAMGMTFIAFEGYEIIVQAGEEVVNPRETIPKAVFYSLAIVIPIYILVAIVCLGAIGIPNDVLAALQSGGEAVGIRASDTWMYLEVLGETGVAEAANQFMPWLGMGAILLVAGAILSTMSALNATTYSSTRVSFAMGRDRYLPAAMSRISPKTRTPVVALLASGALITGMALALPVEEVAAATCVMFLLVFVLVNASAIFIRRKYAAHLRYGYVMPFYPVIPIIAIVGQLCVAVYLFWEKPLSLWITLAWVVIGLAIYYLWSRRQEHELKASPIVLEQRVAPAEARDEVLVPVANPANAEALIELASRLVRGDSQLLLLHVIRVPEQLPYTAAGRFVAGGREVLDAAVDSAESRGVTASGLIRIAHHAGRSIVDTLIERKAETLVMGWSGPKTWARDYRNPASMALSRTRTLIGTEIDHVIEQADAHTVVLRGRLPDPTRRILIPIANPRQGMYALSIAERLADADAAITLLNVRREEEATDEITEKIERVLERPASGEGYRTPGRGVAVRFERVVARDVVESIVERAGEHDLVIVGASAESWLQRRAFTQFHYDLASRYAGPLMLVKARSGRARFTAQQVIEFFSSKEPSR